MYKCINDFLQGSIGKQTVKVSWAGPTVADDGESSDDDESVTENGDVSSIHNAAEQVSVNDEPDSDLVNYDDADGDDEVEADREENFSIDIDPVESTPAVMQLIEPVHSETLLADWNGFKIVGDNIDKNIRPSYQRCDRQTVSLHYFHACAIRDRIDFSSLNNTRPTSVLIDPTDLLPKTADVDALKDEFQILVSRYYTSSYMCHLFICYALFSLCFVYRILVQNINSLSSHKKTIEWHIPSKYTSEMSKQSRVVSLFCQCDI